MAELKHNIQTDSENEIKLESSLIYSIWKEGSAFAGCKAEFEIGTAFVGNGAKIKIKGKSENGKKLGNITDTIRNNKYIGQFDIPEDTEIGDQIYFEVKLSKNGLDGESERIPVFLAPKLKSISWNQEEARRGDLVTLSAEVEDVEDNTEVLLVIYEYDEDKAHDLICEIPATVKGGKIEVKWEYEYHEDTDEIPTKEELEQYGSSYNPPEYFFTIKLGNFELGKEQESGLLKFKDYIEIELHDPTGQPIPNEEYTLILPDGSEREGQLDRNGYAIENGIPPGKCKIKFKNL
jgi:hypothetical protein